MRVLIGQKKPSKADLSPNKGVNRTREAEKSKDESE
jgi:hypothetical protein